MDIYLDHNATSPLDPAAEAAMVPLGRQQFGNPSSVHLAGQLAREAVDAARGQVAIAVNALPPWEVTFTSGGTEAITHALVGLALERGEGHLIATSVEHPAVRETLAWLAGRGFAVTFLPVDRDGRVSPRAVADACQNDTFLLAIQLANNEVGTLQPVAEVAEIARRRGAWLFVDAVQALGKLPVDVVALGGHLYAFSAHKVGGPKGVGCLVHHGDVPLPPLFRGGGQERGLRSGTENVPGIVGFGVATTKAVERQPQADRRWREIRGELLAIAAELPAVTVNGHPTDALQNTISMSFGGVDGLALTVALARRGVMVSAGSACCGWKSEPSPVLLAMGRSEREAQSAIRISMGHDTTGLDLRRAREVLVETVKELRENPAAPSGLSCQPGGSCQS